MKQIILTNIDHGRSYHLFPPFNGTGMYKLIIANKLQPQHNIEIEFDRQSELDALLMAYKRPEEALPETTE